MSVVEDLYHYDELRSNTQRAMFVGEVARPTLVLGSSQPVDVVDASKLNGTSLRRRRGGGGLVLLRPDDVWVDWWLPEGDSFWSPDVRVCAVRVGTWWASVLSTRTGSPVVVHEGSLEGAPDHRVVCFAGRGPGEVFVGGRKAVGLTQWRVREGALLSSVLRVEPTTDVLAYLRVVPEGLREALDDKALDRFGAGDAELVGALRAASQSASPSRRRLEG